MTWEAVKTNKGLALDQKLMLSGGVLPLVRAGAGTAVHGSGDLADVTALSSPTTNTVGLGGIRRNSATMVTVPVTISSVGVTTAYTVKQIGVFATDPDDGTILYMIAEDSTGVDIPTEDQGIGFSAVWNMAITLSNSANVTVQASGILTADDAEATYAHIQHIHSYNDLTDKPTIPEAVVVDGELSTTSENPVQNKVVKAELDKKGNASIITSTNVSVTENSWVADSTYSGYAYKADVTIAGVTSDYFADVCFSNANALSGYYAPVCESGNGYVRLYSTVQQAITIPSIICTKKIV